MLLDRLAKENIYGQLECARNVFLIDAAKKIIWQVQTDFDSNGGASQIFLRMRPAYRPPSRQGVRFNADGLLSRFVAPKKIR